MKTRVDRDQYFAQKSILIFSISFTNLASYELKDSALIFECFLYRDHSFLLDGIPFLIHPLEIQSQIENFLVYTGYTFPEALILPSINPKYDSRKYILSTCFVHLEKTHFQNLGFKSPLRKVKFVMPPFFFSFLNSRY